jgi:hypothetical protein
LAEHTAQSGFTAFGLDVATDTFPPGAWSPSPIGRPDVHIRCVNPKAIEQSWSGRRTSGWDGTIDGASFRAEHGIVGDYRFVHGAQPDPGGGLSSQTRALHHLSADRHELLCAVRDRSDPASWRVVLDSVLFTVSLLHGYEALHAGAVATPTGVIAITASTGGGKSTLLAELLGRGYVLMADDVLALESRGDGCSPIAYPAPPVMTVPVASVPLLGKGASPPPISSLDGESWIAVPVCPEPLPIRALVVLDRGRGSSRYTSRPALTKIENPLAPLLDSLMSFPQTPEREQARFELASSLSSAAGVWRLTADLEAAPSVLADVLLGGEL